MQVRAERAGFYAGRLLQAGEIFTVAPGHRASWFAPVAGEDGTPAQQADVGKPPADVPDAPPVTQKPRRGRPPSGGLRPATSPEPPEDASADPDLP